MVCTFSIDKKIVYIKIKMKFCPDNLCKFCSKFFCCLECRIKHEIQIHFSSFCETVCCDLCNGQDRIVLQRENTTAFIDHLFKFHLPLQCKCCSMVFEHKDDLVTVHTCAPSKNAKGEKLKSKMAGDGKIVPIIEEELESEKVSDKPNENSVADNGSSVRNNRSSMNSSENANHTPPITLVRQTSTPMTKMLHEVKRNNYESMSASSIQMSSIENCSSENDISPPVPSATSNLILFKQPNRRMPIGTTPYRQIMSKSIQRAFSNQGISRVRSVNATPPLDLRTSPVIRRTASMEGNVRPRAVGMRNDANTVDLRTTPVIRRTRHFEAKNLAKAINSRPDGLYGTFIESEENQPDNPKVSPHVSPPKSSLSRSKSTNTFFETCRSFDANVTSSDQISETPKSTGLSKRSSSFSSRHRIKKTSDGDKWFTPSPENAENIPAGSTKILNVGSSNKNELKHERSETTKKDDDKDKDLNNQPSKGIIWSLVSSVFRFTSTGGGAAANNLASDDKNSLIKRCASFTGFLPKKPNLQNLTDENPYKRRRTTTLSEVESFSQLGDDGDISAKRMQRINARPPINRMRQS